MKKIICVLLALCMLLSVSALAENGIEFTCNVQVNRNQLVSYMTSQGQAPDEMTLAVLDPVLALIGATSLHGFAGEEGGKAELLLHDAEILDLSVSVGDDIVLFSDLLPGYALSVSGSTLAGIGALVPDTSAFDPAPYAAAVQEYIDGLQKTEEKGAWFIDGRLYTDRTTIMLSNIDTTKLINSLMELAVKDLEEMGMADMAKAAGADIEFEPMRIPGEDTFVPLVICTNDRNETYIKMGEEFGTVSLCITDSSAYITVQDEDYFVLVITFVTTDDAMYLDASYVEDDTSVQYTCKLSYTAEEIREESVMTLSERGKSASMKQEAALSFSDTGLDADSSYYFLDLTTPVISGHAHLAPCAGAVLPDASGYTVLKAEDLLRYGVDEAQEQAIISVLQNQTLPSLLVKVVNAAPEISSFIITFLSTVDFSALTRR
ncbi:MAG: hypothetical protein CW338_11655 [Clostridiales bacterium]|nr:hypothetical protein [Clostridiales bacterium]